MMKINALVFAFFISAFANAQEADSLRTLISKEKIPAKKSQLLYQLAADLSSNDTVKAWQTLKEARRFSDKKQLLPGLDYFGRAMIIFDQDGKRAEKLFSDAIREFCKVNSTLSFEYQSRSWNNIGILAQMTGRDDRYLDILIKHALSLAQKSGNQLLVAQDYQNIGLINFNLKLYDKALSYYEKSLSILQVQPPSSKRNYKLTDVLNALTEIYIYKNDASKAAELAKMAKQSLDKSRADDLYTSYFLNSSKIFELKNDYNAALKQIDSGLAIAGKTPSAYDRLRLLNEKSFILKNLKRYDDAISIVKAIAAGGQFAGLAKNSAIYHDELAEMYALKGDHGTAYSELRLAKKISDSLHSKNLEKSVTELETKFRTAEKEKEILQKEVEIGRKNNYLRLLGLFSLLMLSVLAIVYFYLQNKRRAAEQKRFHIQQQLRQKEQQAQLDLTKAMLQGEEKERERIAKDLHDGLGGMLAGVKLNLSAWAQQNPEMHRHENFSKILGRLDGSVTELRRIARNLMPEALLNFGLETAIRDLCDFYSNENTAVDFQPIHLQGNLPRQLRLQIYRIVQELLANAAKHSGATHILVQCSQNGGRFYITVEDNGKGFPAEIDQSKGLGVRNLRNRVEFLKGQIEYQSAEDEGTSVNVELNTDAS